MKSISNMSAREYLTWERRISAAIFDEPCGSLMIWQLSIRFKRSQKWLYEFIEGNDAFMINVAMTAGGGIYNLPKKDHSVELIDRL